MSALGTTALFLSLLTCMSQIATAQKKSPASKPPKEPLAKLVEQHFARWDRDHDDVLDLAEVDHEIEDHSVRGRQAALIICLRRHLTKNGNRPVLPHKQLVELVQQGDFAKSVERSAKHLETIDRELFLPADPNLANFSQGRLGDCYLLAAIAAQVHRNPHVLRDMIHPLVTGGFDLMFGNGETIHVAPLTDCELLLGAKLDDRHGSWLAVLEKGYGLIRKRDRAKHGDKTANAATVPVETLSVGDPATIISLLTGRQAESLRLSKLSHHEELPALLVELTRKRRLICVSTGKAKAPPGMVSHHAYTVLDYNPDRRQVQVFNPLGTNFTPKNPPGTAHGYPTQGGLFTVPLDQFQQVFGHLVYETGRPLAKRPSPRH